MTYVSSEKKLENYFYDIYHIRRFYPRVQHKKRYKQNQLLYLFSTYLKMTEKYVNFLNVLFKHIF